MADDEISPGEIACYRVLLAEYHDGPHRSWLSNTEIGAKLAVRTRLAEGRPPAPSTVRKATERLHRFGLVDRVYVQPAYKYRLAEQLDSRGAAYRYRLHRAAEAAGQPIDTPTTNLDQETR